jgi:mono/diheme cytochrome c family protein
MKPWSEGKAALLAVLASATVLACTYGVTLIMRSASFSIPGLVPSMDAAMVSPLPKGDPKLGRHLFLLNCAHCHGDDARGGEGPDLHNLHKSDARIHQQITFGTKGEMPSFGKKFQESDIQALIAYLRTLRS